MQTREWKTKDKSEWPRGQWDDEPDKMQWLDEATGRPCLIVRNSFGGLCGYMGVDKSHHSNSEDRVENDYREGNDRRGVHADHRSDDYLKRGIQTRRSACFRW